MVESSAKHAHVGAAAEVSTSSVSMNVEPVEPTSGQAVLDREPPPSTGATSPPQSVDTASAHVVTAMEAALLAILDAPRDAGESVSSAFARKERELAVVLQALAPRNARELHRRLVDPLPGDMLATRFSGLVAERRDRLLAVLCIAMLSDRSVVSGSAA
jgi:hypothetical protein